MKNKRAWIRIVEAVAAILILTGVLLAMYTNKADKTSTSDFIEQIQQKILDKIVSDNNLRSSVLNGDETTVSVFINQSLLKSLDYGVRICSIEELSCNLDANSISRSLNKDVFVSERIISSDLTTYNPKKIRLFTWEK